MKFCAQCPLIWLVLLILILFTAFQKVNSASTHGKCENCTNLKELSIPLVLLGIVSILFIIICLIRCLPKFTQIMFSSAEQLSAAQREQHTQRLSQILKRQHQLRAQQLARQSPNCLPGQQTDLLEKGIFQDPFLNAGVLGSVLLQPSRLEQQLDEKQQVPNGLSKQSDLDSKPAIIPQPLGRHQTFAAAGIAATAVSHLLHQQRNNTLRKQLLAKQQQNKINDSRQDKTLTPPLINKQNKPVLTRFLKKSNTVRPVQLQHSLSLTSFALPRNVGQLNQQLNLSNLSNQSPSQSNNSKLKLANGIKPNLKYNRMDKNIMTINQQPITLDLLYKNAVADKPIADDMQFYSDREEFDKRNLMNNRLLSKSVQNIEQPIAWLDDSSENDEPPLPAPLPLELLNRNKRPSISKFNQSTLKCRSMPMINQPEHALYNYYDEDQHDTSLNEDLHHHFDDYPFDSAYDFRNAFRTVDNYPPTTTSASVNQQTEHQNYDNETCALHSSLNHLLQNTNAQEELDQRTELDSASFNRTNESYNIEQWPDAQLQQFLNAFNRYTQQRPSVNRNHTRSLYDLY